MAKNKFMTMSAVETLNMANHHNMFLPDIQREYVWGMEDIECLFESILDGYPIGTCIFWKTNRRTINSENPNLYYFFSRFKKGETKNEKLGGALTEDLDYYIVLDGQQRITSLLIALQGSYKYYKGGKGKPRSDLSNWQEKELYYNLDYYNNNVDDEHLKKRFCFLTEDEMRGGNYYKVKSILTYDSLDELKGTLSGKSANCISDLCSLFKRLHSAGEDGLIHFYSIVENTYDEALNIFVRVNSTGRKLTKSDLLFSTLINGWKQGKKEIDELLEAINSIGDGYNFSRDYLMRLSLVLVDASTSLKVSSFTNEIVCKIREKWEKIKQALMSTVLLLKDVGICGDVLLSYNATIPLVYYVYKGGSFKSNESKRELIKFLAVSMVKGLFGVASNSALSSSRSILNSIDCKKKPFSLSFFDKLILTGGRSFNVSENDIDYWFNNFEKGSSTYIILALLYPDIKLGQSTFEQDHCHPWVAFEHKNIKHLNLSFEEEAFWRSKRNLLPNLQFLVKSENSSKKEQTLKDWMARGNIVKYYPDGVSNEFSSFEEFFEERRKLMVSAVCKVFGLNTIK